MLIITDTPSPTISRVVTDDIATDDLPHAYASAAWTVITEPGDSAAGRLRQEFGAVLSLGIVMQDGAAAQDALCGLEHPPTAEQLSRWRERANHTEIHAALQRAANNGDRLLIPGSKHWPSQLDDLGVNAPAALWAKGDLDVLHKNAASVAISGSRASTSYGEEVTAMLADAAASNSVTVISGCSYGTDGTAHRTTLARGGDTIAVLAGGLDRPYPFGHKDLLAKIEQHGLTLSEVPSGATPTRWRFLQRGRIIAALASATVIVEAGTRSNSMALSKTAASLHRPIGAVPGPITSAMSMGCHRIIAELNASIIESGHDMLRMVGLDDPRRS